MIKLIGILTGFIPALISWLVYMITRKWGFYAALATLYVGLTVAFIACIASILSAIFTYTAVPSWLTSSLGAVWPSSFVPCLAAICSALICRAAYDMAVLKVRLLSQV